MVVLAASALAAALPAGPQWTRQYFILSRFSLELPSKVKADPPQYVTPGGIRKRVQVLRFEGIGYLGAVKTTAALTGALPKDFDFVLRNEHSRMHSSIPGDSRSETRYVSASGVTGLETVIRRQGRPTWVRTYLSNSSLWENVISSESHPEPIAAARRILSSFRIGIPAAPAAYSPPVRRIASRKPGAAGKPARKTVNPKTPKIDPIVACRQNQLRIAEAEEQYRRFVKDDRFTTDLEELKRFMGIPRCPSAAGYTVKLSDGTQPLHKGSHAPVGALIIHCANLRHKPFTPFLEDDRPNHVFAEAMEAYCEEKRRRVLQAVIDYRRDNPDKDEWRSLPALFPKGRFEHLCPTLRFQYAIGRAPENLDPRQKPQLPNGTVFVACGTPGHSSIVSAPVGGRQHSIVNRCRVNILRLAEAVYSWEGERERSMFLPSTENLRRHLGRLPDCPDGGRYELSQSADFDISSAGFMLPQAVPMIACSTRGHGTYAVAIDAPQRGLPSGELNNRKCLRHQRVIANAVRRLLEAKPLKLGELSLVEVWQLLGDRLQCPIDGELKLSVDPHVAAVSAPPLPEHGLTIGCSRHGSFNPGLPPPLD